MVDQMGGRPDGVGVPFVEACWGVAVTRWLAAMSLLRAGDSPTQAGAPGPKFLSSTGHLAPRRVIGRGDG